MRVETGVVRFGNDWPGVFLRGDDAHGFAAALREVLKDSKNEIASKYLEGLAHLLWASGHGSGVEGVEMPEPLSMKTFQV